MLAAMGVQTIGAVDSTHKLPSPRVYAVVWLLYWILGLVAAFGEGTARLAKAVGFVVLITLGMSKAGLATIGWLQGIGGRLSGQPESLHGWGGLTGLIGAAQQAAGRLVAGATGQIAVPSSANATHCTDGLAGFPAIDLMGPLGAAVLAPEGGTLSNPHLIPWREGFGGQTFTFTADDGTVYWMTHMDESNAMPAGRYEAGDVIGYLTDDPTKADLINGAHVHVGSPAYTGLSC